MMTQVKGHIFVNGPTIHGNPDTTYLLADVFSDTVLYYITDKKKLVSHYTFAELKALSNQWRRPDREEFENFIYHLSLALEGRLLIYQLFEDKNSDPKNYFQKAVAWDAFKRCLKEGHCYARLEAVVPEDIVMRTGL